MIDEAIEDGTAIEVQGRAVRGLQRLDQLADRLGGRPDRRREGQREGRRDRRAGRARSSSAAGDEQGGAARAWPTTRRTRRGSGSSPGARTSRSTTASSTRAPKNVGKGFQKKIGWARYPRIEAGKPSRPTARGHQPRRRARTPSTPDLAFEAAQLPRTAQEPDRRGREGRPAADDRERLREPEDQEGATRSPTCCGESIAEGAPRPVNPAYSDISLAIQKTFHPRDKIKPDERRDASSKDRLEKAAEGKIF